MFTFAVRCAKEVPLHCTSLCEPRVPSYKVQAVAAFKLTCTAIGPDDMLHQSETFFLQPPSVQQKTMLHKKTIMLSIIAYIKV
jgi:hypothetical protein